MPCLANLITKNRDAIEKHLHLNDGRWCRLPERIAKCECEDEQVCEDEQLWTFLAACGYAIAGVQGIKKLTKILTGSDLPQPDCAKIWMEVTPFPPRKGESTDLDLALGTIAIREKTKSGIRLGERDKSSSCCSWICFCEMKWYGDISTRTKRDVNRNQLARVIENALYFNDSERCSVHVYVALCTPKAFKNREVNSRLYQYKFEEYEADRNQLVKDIEACVLENREHASGNVADRVGRLKLRWPTYDEIFAQIPNSAISEKLKEFWQKRGSYQGRAQ